MPGVTSDAAKSAFERLKAEFAARRPLRAGSLIVTVFGDAAAPRGGGLFLADLFGLLEQLDVNDSQTRTALSRLVADGWLVAERIGRQSFYRLSTAGARRFHAAAQRIYRDGTSDWDGAWAVALLPDAARDRRAELLRQLQWLGFGQLAPAVLVHPAPDRESLAQLVADWPAAERPVVVAGPSQFDPSPDALRGLVARCWDFSGLDLAYRRFAEEIAPLGRALAAGDRLTPLDCLVARVMLVHDYRRVILRDPLLPAELMPPDWSGRVVLKEAAALYRLIAGPAEGWISDHWRGRDGGPLPPAGSDFGRRFGGL